MMAGSDGNWSSGWDEGAIEDSPIGRRRLSPDKMDQTESTGLSAILTEWLKHQEEERLLRNRYGRVLLWALIVQLAVMDLILVLSVLGLCTVDPAALPYWLGALIIEVIGLVTVVARGIFRNTTGEFHKLIASIMRGEGE